METVLFEGVFDQNLVKMAKNDRFLATFFKFAPLPLLQFEENWIF